MTWDGITVHGTPAEDHRTWFVTTTPTRADWPADMTDDERAVMARHAEDLAELVRDRTVVFAGPTEDLRSGLALYDDVTLDEVLGLVSEDPAVVEGLMTAVVRATHLSFYAGGEPRFGRL